MAKKTEDHSTAQSTAQNTEEFGGIGGRPTTAVAGPTAPASAAEASAAPTAASTATPSAALTGYDYDITLKSTTGQEQVVVGHGPDSGLAAQDAMRHHPGWTADHSRTREHHTDHADHVDTSER